MPEKLIDLLDEFAPALDQALVSDGLEMALGATTFRVRVVGEEPLTPEADASEPPPAPERPSYQVERRERSEVMVGFDRRPDQPRATSTRTPDSAPPPPPNAAPTPRATTAPAPEPPPAPRPPPPPKAARPPRKRPDHVKVIRFDDEPPKPKFAPEHRQAAAKVDEERLAGIFQLAPPEGVSAAEIAAWFGTVPALLEPLLGRMVEEGELRLVAGRYRRVEPA